MENAHLTELGLHNLFQLWVERNKLFTPTIASSIYGAALAAGEFATQMGIIMVVERAKGVRLTRLPTKK